MTELALNDFSWHALHGVGDVVEQSQLRFCANQVKRAPSLSAIIVAVAMHFARCDTITLITPDGRPHKLPTVTLPPRCLGRPMGRRRKVGLI